MFSRCSFLDSIAFLTRMRVFSSESGFSRKSYAPSFVARTAVSMVPWPEIMMTSGGLSNSRILSRVSRPSTPGSQISSSTTSKAVLRSSSRHASPLPTEEAAYPSSARMPDRESRFPASSSTMRMRCMLDGGRCGCGLGHYRELNDEPCADRMILLHADRAVVTFHDPADYGEAESVAAL